MATPQLTQAERDYQLARPNENWAHGLSTYRIIITVIVELAIVLRMWGRRLQKIALRADDYVLILAGAGYAANIIYALAFSVSRISLILLYKRVFVKRWFAYVCWFMIFAYSSFATAVLIREIFNTLPIAAQLDKKVKVEHSINVSKYLFAIHGFNLGSDLILLILPLFIIWSLQARKLTRLGISFILCLGTLTLISATMRLYYAIKYKDSKDPGCDSSSPGTGKNGSYWTVTELSLGLLCPCLVTFQPIIIHFYRACLLRLSPHQRNRISRITCVEYEDPSDSTLGDRGNRLGSDEEGHRKGKVDGVPSSHSIPSDAMARERGVYEDKSHSRAKRRGGGDENGRAINQDTALHLQEEMGSSDLPG
ncbi:uncharacterized protein KY384_007474 [Bacidia gigantensis]|uniref:uncharacterized protein n=1 Tax=Bacidia gigantensis TaxID=2732470 RepID=UPI001D037F57|nr:uncharacterized protein KY384_007474 [Bacidia gigantensis]KAG8527322.1 hypothetical protein KY384_007474 [Bacidia gigantensis]